MLIFIIYLIAIIIELIFAIFCAVFIAGLLWSSIKGSPYVPTKYKELKQFLKAAGLAKGKVFLELGCGDGRVTRTAVKEFGVQGIGVDVNALLIYWARFLAKLSNLKHITFKVENIDETDFSKADFIYIFLLPKFMEKLKPRIQNETKKGAIIISHGFKFEGWEKYNFKTIPNKPFPTYYYKVK